MSKKNPKQVFLLNLEPYKQNCLVVVNGEFVDAYNALKKYKPNHNVKAVLDEIENNRESYFLINRKPGSAFLYNKLPSGYIMMLYHEDSWIDTVDSVVHESLHLTAHVLRKAGLSLCEDSEEAYTYLHGYIVTEILRKIF